MNAHAKILDDLVEYLHSTLGSSVGFHLVRQAEDSLTMQVGTAEDALLSLEVSDPDRPAFRISYPERRGKRSGRYHMVVTFMDGALRPGVAWVARQLADHGAVTPEFKD